MSSAGRLLVPLAGGLSALLLSGCLSIPSSPLGNGRATFSGDLSGSSVITGLGGTRHCAVREPGVYDGSFEAILAGQAYLIQIAVPGGVSIGSLAVTTGAGALTGTGASPSPRLASLSVQPESSGPVPSLVWASTGGTLTINDLRPSGTMRADLVGLDPAGRRTGGTLHLAGPWSCS